MNRLTNAGYNASAVQEVVNRLLNGNYTSININEIAQEVIQGKWGMEKTELIDLLKLDIITMKFNKK